MAKKIGIIGFTVMMVIVLASCGGEKTKQEIFLTMDTMAEVTVRAADNRECDALIEEIRNICINADNLFSRTIPKSDISLLNEIGSRMKISAEAVKLLTQAVEIKKLTGGAYEPAIGDLMDVWGFYSDDSPALPEKKDFYPLLEKNRDVKITESGIEFDDGLKFDMGGIAKGYVTAEINEFLEGKKIKNALISFGSSILAKGTKKDGNLWTIGIKNPLDPNSLSGYIHASDKYISVSGGYERYIEINGRKYCHIIDPATGYPVDNDLLSVAVVMDASKGAPHENGAYADALSTALYIMGKDAALDFYNSGVLDFEMILFVKTDDGTFDILSTNLMFNEIKGK